MNNTEDIDYQISEAENEIQRIYAKINAIFDSVEDPYRTFAYFEIREMRLRISIIYRRIEALKAQKQSKSR